MDTSVVRYGIIGCGEHAWRAHALPGLQIPELELVAVYDPDRVRAESFPPDEIVRRVMKIPKIAGSEDELLADPDIDAVAICSPDRFHADSLIKAVDAGKHVLVEKPVADEVSNFWRVHQALHLASQRGLIVTSCHPRRFNPPYIRAKEMLPKLVGRFGRPLAVETDFSYHAPSKTGLHKGLLIDHVNHEYDLVCFLFGRVPCQAWKIEDAQTRYQAFGTRDDGLSFFFRGTRLLEAKRYPEWLRVRFERGLFELSTGDGTVRVIDHETGRVETIACPKTDYEASFGCLMSNFARSVLGHEPNYLDHDQIIKNTTIGLRLTEGTAWDSERT